MRLLAAGVSEPSPTAPFRYSDTGFIVLARARAPGERRAARPLHAEALLPAARHARHDLQPAGRLARPHRADRVRPGPDAARRGPRPARPPAPRRRRARGALLDGGRPRALLPDAARRRHGRRPPLPLQRVGPRHVRAERGGRSHARARLGHGLGLLAHPGLVLSGGLGRAHGLHGHVHLDGSADPDVRHHPDEPRASGGQGLRRRAAPARERHRGRQALRAQYRARGRRGRDAARRRREGRRAAARQDPHRPRRPRDRGLGAAQGPGRRARDEPDRRGRRGPAQRRPPGQGPGREAPVRLLARARARRCVWTRACPTARTRQRA